MTLAPSFAANITDRPAFNSLESLRAYALAVMDQTTCAGVPAHGCILDVALAGVAMTVDCERNDQGAAGQSVTVRWLHY